MAGLLVLAVLMVVVQLEMQFGTGHLLFLTVPGVSINLRSNCEHVAYFFLQYLGLLLNKGANLVEYLLNNYIQGI